MNVRISFQGLHQTKGYQYLIRFVFGGFMTAATGLIANHYGPVIGGLFLAIPSIFPASVTLVQRHKKEQEKDQHGKDEQQSEESGKESAGKATEGAVWGCFGLFAFALVIRFLSIQLAPWVVLLLALLVWFVISVLAWLISQTINRRQR